MIVSVTTLNVQVALRGRYARNSRLNPWNDIGRSENESEVAEALHEYLDMKTLSALWEPRLLTLGHNRNRVTTSKECLAMFSRNPNEFLGRFIAVDETWIHQNTPETKEELRQWLSPGESAPKKAKVCRPIRSWTTVFWDARGVMHIDYLE